MNLNCHAAVTATGFPTRCRARIELRARCGFPIFRLVLIAGQKCQDCSPQVPRSSLILNRDRYRRSPRYRGSYPRRHLRRTGNSNRLRPFPPGSTFSTPPGLCAPVTLDATPKLDADTPEVWLPGMAQSQTAVALLYVCKLNSSYARARAPRAGLSPSRS